MRAAFLLLTAGSGIALLAGLAPASPQESVPMLVSQVTVMRAGNACFSELIRATGYLVARETAIANLLPGDRVVEVLAHEGDRVAADQILARVERQVPDLSKSAAGAFKTDTVALKSPISGVVIGSTALVGATALLVPLFTIAVDGDIEINAEIPSIHVPSLSPGQTARVQIRDTRELSGRVRLVPAAIDRKTQLGYARVSLEHDPELRFGMFARITIDADRSCGLSIPDTAIAYRTEGTSVQIVRNDRIETHNVQIGIRADSDTEIREGLNSGDLVVVNTGTSLRDGDVVKPVEVAAARAKLR